jgi:hypothetical protein
VKGQRRSAAGMRKKQAWGDGSVASRSG